LRSALRERSDGGCSDAGRDDNGSMTRVGAGSVTRMCFVFLTGEQCAGFAALTLLQSKI
jgi:hypothetical protein